MDISCRFKEFTKPNYFSRVDTSHILELHIGLDEKSRKAIELRSGFDPRKINGTAALEVNQYKKSEYNTIRFSLCDEEISGLFYKFCEDLIEQTRSLKEAGEGYNTICNRFFQWKKLFVSSKKNYLSEPEIMGLIGEILFFRDDLATELGINEALKSWSGQELTHKDFSNKNDWFEVKTISRGKTSVKISSLEQLDSDKDGKLIVYSLEKMSKAYNGIKLNDLIIDTFNRFDNDESKEEFMTKVSLHGYEYNAYYDDFVYEVSNVSKYLVNDRFPKLTKSVVPSEVVKVSYELLLAELRDFEI